MSHATRSAAALAVVVFVASVTGCDHRLQKVVLPETRETRPGHMRSAPPSAKASFTLGAENLPPAVEITNPVPSALYEAVVTSPLTIHWQGSDPDGQIVRYAFRLFGPRNPDYAWIPDWIAFAAANPDSLRAAYAPDFASWTSMPPETTSVQYTNLNPNTEYLFAIIAFDEAGDYDRVFSASKNMLFFRVATPGTIGPRLTMFNGFFNYTYPSGGYFNDDAHTIPVEMPAGQPAIVNWVATPVLGADIHWYRWALDLVDLTDETPRENEATDLRHWSARSLTITSATLPPVNPPPGTRRSELLYIEVQDTNGLRSLGIVELVFRRPAFSRTVAPSPARSPGVGRE